MQPLSLMQIVQGCRKILENAEELLEEAQVLFERQSYVRAYALAHIAGEELGKLPMLDGTSKDVIGGNVVDWKHFYKRFRNHPWKIGYMLASNLNPWLEAADNANEADIAIQKFNQLGRRVDEFNRLRNKAFYVDLDEGYFQKPSEVVSRKEALEMLTMVCEVLSWYRRHPDELTEEGLKQKFLRHNEAMRKTIGGRKPKDSE